MEFLKRNKVCTHTQVKPDVDYAYCPDCGELVENQWYLVEKVLKLLRIFRKSL